METLTRTVSMPSTDPGELRVSSVSPSQWQRVLSIEVPRERLEAERARVMRDLRKRTARPGFRKGHVPAAIIERDFAARIESDALENLVPQVCDQAIRSQNLDVVSTPKVENLVLDDPQVVRFDLVFEVRPSIEIGSLEGLGATRWVSSVTDEDLASALESLRQQQAQFVAVERPAQDGDFVWVSYVSLDEQGRERATQKVENYPFELGAGGVVAEFETAVRGLGAGDSGRAEVRYADDHDNSELAGKVVAFILTLQSVKEKHLPPLDDDLARDLGLENLEAVRTRVRADLERRQAEESEHRVRESLVDRLIERHPFEVPGSMLGTYLEAVAADYDERHRRMQSQPDPQEREEYLSRTRPAAERAVRRQLLLEQLAQQHGLTMTEADVDKWIEERVQAGSPDVAQARAYWADSRRRRRLRGELTEERVFTFLESKAEIAEVRRPPSSPGPSESSSG